MVSHYRNCLKQQIRGVRSGEEDADYKGNLEDYLFEKGFHDLIYPCFSEFLETE